jgi:hypothetical protein
MPQDRILPGPLIAAISVRLLDTVRSLRLFGLGPSGVEQEATLRCKTAGGAGYPIAQ